LTNSLSLNKYLVNR